MSGGKAHPGVRMEHARFGKPAFCQSVHSSPDEPVLLAPSAECPPPEPCHPFAKYTQPVQVSWYRVIVEVALDDRFEPLSRLLDWIVHAPAELLLNFLQLRPHALGDRLALYGKVPVPVLVARL
jgi:hypothetical protein